MTFGTTQTMRPFQSSCILPEDRRQCDYLFFQRSIYCEWLKSFPERGLELWPRSPKTAVKVIENERARPIR